MSLKRTLLVVPLVLVTGLVGPGVALGQDQRAGTVGSPDGPDPYFPKDGNGGYQVVSYKIANTYRPGTDRLSGKTAIKARATQDLTRFYLDLALTPDRVVVDGARARFSKPDMHTLRITPQKQIADGAAFRVRVSYHGRPSKVRTNGVRPGRDLYFHRRGETIAMGEPQNGPWWFAANETPQDKATYDIRTRVPRGQEAISNGELVSDRTRGRWTTWRWRMRDPMTTYLAFFAAGDFAIRQGTADGYPYLYAVSKRLTRADQRAAMNRVTRSTSIVAWLADQFGDYPFSSVGAVVAGIYVPYSLENQTRPVYDLSGLDRLLVTHELAHQWFGDDVSLSLWKDTWLNEGFATYAEWLYDEANGGQTTDQHLRAAYDARDGATSFWGIRVSDPGAADIFSDSVYVRGAMMLAALRNRIGPANLATVLQQWVSQHHGGNATGEEFRSLAGSVSGQDLDSFFAEWLDQTDEPANTTANGLG